MWDLGNLSALLIWVTRKWVTAMSQTSSRKWTRKVLPVNLGTSQSGRCILIPEMLWWGNRSILGSWRSLSCLPDQELLDWSLPARWGSHLLSHICLLIPSQTGKKKSLHLVSVLRDCLYLEKDQFQNAFTYIVCKIHYIYISSYTFLYCGLSHISLRNNHQLYPHVLILKDVKLKNNKKVLVIKMSLWL